MKYTKNMIFLFLLSFLIPLISSLEYKQLDPIIFGDEAESELEGEGIYKVVASYKTDVSQKYLYIHSLNYEAEMYLNKAIFKIYFKEISNEDSELFKF